MSDGWFPHRTAEENLIAFLGDLRRLGFRLGAGETIAALEALAVVGIEDRDRVEQALALVCCADVTELPAFHDAFERFFAPTPLGTAQTRQPGEEGVLVRDRRPGADDPAAPPEGHREESDPEVEDGNGGSGNAAELLDDEDEDGLPAGVRSSRFSPSAGEAPPPVIDEAFVDALRPAADRLVTRVRLGRARRYRPVAHGPRFDFRRTLRGSLQQGGEIAHLRWLGQPPRNPRFAVLIDGSRSMAAQVEPALHLAAALLRRTRRAEVFVFSTAVERVTDELREGRLGSVGEAWGGGTRIGASLARFVHDHGTGLLSSQTLVVIVSDGLDVGELPELRDAMRELDRRSAGVLWLNPLLATPGYEPSAGGMRAALPYVATFATAQTPAEFAAVAGRVRV